jgi:translation initiation factor 1 (eIF-1/SUI1)
VIRNVDGDAEALLSVLKKRCGAGGVVREGAVEVQGDHRTKVEAFLAELRNADV